ncbi:hypothetical protein [Hyphomicrobium sp. 2TAF46]|uniref:hypothetical protein n=1 Tax=Hyphomicrobium sp. 2TAF46 TaxID=3233019 RepID=UPI003F91C5EF
MSIPLPTMRYGKVTADQIDREKLRALVARECREWAELYAKEPEGDALVRGLMRGAEAIVLEHLGLMPPAERARFEVGFDRRGFFQGRQCMAYVDLYEADIFKKAVPVGRRTLGRPAV